MHDKHIGDGYLIIKTLFDKYKLNIMFKYI